MFFKKVLFSIGFVGSLVFLPGCVYNTEQLPKCSSNRLDGKVSLTYDVLNKRKSVRYLGRNVFKKGYLPVLVTLSNSSDVAYDVSLDALTVAHVPAEQVIEKMRLRTKARVLAPVLAGAALAVAILCGGGLLLLEYFIAAASVGGEMLIAGGLGGAALGIPSASSNKKFRKIIAQKAFPEKVSLLPHSSLTGVIFFDKNALNMPFGLTLKDTSNGKSVYLNAEEVC